MGFMDLFSDRNEKAARDEYAKGYDKARRSSFGSLDRGEKDLRGEYGRARGYYRDFELCRNCLRLFALKGEIPGVIKASW